MAQLHTPSIIRKSVSILIFKIVALQGLVVLAYVGIRVSKLLVFRELFADQDYHDLNFWLGILVFMLVVVAQTAILIAIVLQWFYEFYEIKKDIIVHTNGVFKRKEDIYSLKTIEAGNVEQTLPGKLFNYGTVKIYSPVLKREYSLVDIPNPQVTRDALVALLSKKTDEPQKIIPREILPR
jgi:uncharacterized membrane protein YdbT with pleckstrin-like domain